MYCKNCGQQIDERTSFCPYCGINTAIDRSAHVNDAPSAGFAVLGFFIPIVGLILYLVYESKQPKRAKSAGKGALIGFVTNMVIIIVSVILYIIGVSFVSNNLSSSLIITDERNDDNSNHVDTDSSSLIITDERNDDISEKYASVTFEEFKITNNGYYDETSLDITVKNVSDKQYTFYITIEAVDKDGARLGTDIIYADRLNAGQSISLTAFEYVDEEKIDEFKNASFKVLDIQYYNY